MPAKRGSTVPGIGWKRSPWSAIAGYSIAIGGVAKTDG